MSVSKIVAAAASGIGGDVLNVEDVFSTYLYEGNDTSQTITNGIDLDGEGGMTWLKTRDDTHSHYLFDTERGAGYYLNSDTTGAQAYHATAWVTGFNSDGFDIGYSAAINDDANDHASWTFRKAPKFFDVVTYTGDSNSSRVISHNLGSAVGMIIIKTLNSSDSWNVFHRGLDNGLGTGRLFLDLTNSVDNNTLQFLSADSSSVTFANNAAGNYSGNDYVMYLFAHNNNDGTFGPDGDADIIKCGTIDGNQTVDLGFEPQWVMIKRYDAAGNWYMLDTMRGMPVGSDNANMYANRTNAESAGGEVVRILPNGLQSVVSANHIYMAIRRGTKVPESGTEVFAIDTMGSTSGNPAFKSNFVVDMALYKQYNGTQDWAIPTRLMGLKHLEPNSTDAEKSDGTVDNFAFNTGYNNAATNSSYYSWMWKRAPGYFDVVAYSGSTSTQNISHNLGVQPEMIWIKNRDESGTSWTVLFTSLGARKYLSLDTADGAVSLPLYNGTDFFANTLPTSSVFTVGGGTAGGGYDNVGSSGSNYIAYLFASLNGISKVGSFSHTYGGTTNVDCGFTSGARFVLWKRTDGTRHWEVFDTTRGIVAGNDAYLRLSDTAAQTSGDYIDPYSAGFSIGSALGSGDFIFYAIA